MAPDLGRHKKSVAGKASQDGSIAIKMIYTDATRERAGWSDFPA